MLRPKTLDTHVQLVILTLTSPMGINLRNRSALVLELETKESFVSLITKLNNKTNVCVYINVSYYPLYRGYFSQTSKNYFCLGFSCCPYYGGVQWVFTRRELTVYIIH